MTLAEFSNQINYYISKDKTGEAINAFLEFSDGSMFYGKVLLLSSRYYKHKGDKLLGINYDSKELNEIKASILELLNEVINAKNEGYVSPSLKRNNKTKLKNSKSELLPTIGFIGLGKMGKPMAKLLIDHDFPLVFHSSKLSTINEFQSLGGTYFDSYDSVARNANIIITMLSDDEIFKHVVLGDNGILKGIKEGATLIDMSTTSPRTIKEIKNTNIKKDFYVLDAPVIGDIQEAASGELTILVGGNVEVVDKARRIFNTLGNEIYHVGPLGAGQTVKLCHQALATSVILLSKPILELCKNSKVDLIKLHQIVEPFYRPTLVHDVTFRIGNNRNPISSALIVDTVLKDLELMLNLAKEYSINLPIIEACYNVYKEASKVGLGKNNFSSIKSYSFSRIDNFLINKLEGALETSYPKKWKTEWLSLPISSANDSVYKFQVICSDLHKIKKNFPSWPPSSQNPQTWIQWYINEKEGFWLRPKKFDPILRDRFILLEEDEITGNKRRSKLSPDSVLHACHFAAMSGRIVWHNPKNGGASSPQSAHFQSMPLNRNDGKSSIFTLPCCNFNIGDSPWYKVKTIDYCLINRGYKQNEYPVLGSVVWGRIDPVSTKVWNIINEYDSSLSCNLVIQPTPEFKSMDKVRVFIFPRNRVNPNHLVRESFLVDEEKILLNNNRGGIYSNWSFAGVEMGLLTQVEWGNLFEVMRLYPNKWGETLLKVLYKLSLIEGSSDWQEFSSIVKNEFKS